jgi:hypothetical protein
MAPRKLRPKHRNSIRCAIDFSDSGPFVEGDTEDTRRWVHVAISGLYKGYRGGTQPFEFTREIFDQMVANLHAHPSYRAGANGEGEVDVVPWDFEHQNDPDDATVAMVGLPAHGWTSDLKVEVEGEKAHLYALTRLLQPALGYVLTKRYRQCSIDMAFEVTHPVTAKNVGAVLFAVALTNRPFIEGMEGLAASSDAYGYFSQANSATEAFCSLRKLFGLGALAQPVDLMSSLQQLAAYVGAGTAPIGVDVEEIVGCVRQILALPALTPAQEVLDAAGQIVQRLVAEAGPQASAQEKRMDPKKLAALAALLGCSSTEEAVEASLTEFGDVRKKLRVAFRLKARDGDTILLEAAAEGQGATEKLSALLKALGVEDVEGGVSRITELMKAAADLEAAMPELSELRTAKAATEETAIEKDVEEAMASHRIPESCKELLLSSRKADAAKFFAKWPKKAPAPVTQLTAKQKQALTTSVTARGARTTDDVTASGDGRLEGHVYLSDYEGRNADEKAIAYLAAKRPGFANLSWEKQCASARLFKREPNVHVTVPS